jgi:hypothetical protein
MRVFYKLSPSVILLSFLVHYLANPSRTNPRLRDWLGGQVSRSLGEGLEVPRLVEIGV